VQLLSIGISRQCRSTALQKITIRHSLLAAVLSVANHQSLFAVHYSLFATCYSLSFWLGQEPDLQENFAD